MSLLGCPKQEKDVFEAPPCPRSSKEWQSWDQKLDPDHRARWVKKYVEQLDLSDVCGSYLGVGSKAYDPRLMLAMVVYEMLKGSTSPTQWWKNRKEDGLPLRWLGCGHSPCRASWYNFKNRLGPFLMKINKDLIHQAQADGKVTGEIGALDGTFVRDCASRHRLDGRERLDQYIAALNAQIKLDHQEPLSVNSDEEIPHPGWMARTPQGRRQQLLRFVEARRKLTVLLRQNAKRQKSKQLPENKVKISLSDPDAVLGRDKEKVFGPVYNLQCTVDVHSRLILSYGVFSQANDSGMLIPMVDRTREVLDHHLKSILADASYVSILDLKDCETRGVKLIAPYQENDFTLEKKLKKAKKFAKELFIWSDATKTYKCPRGHQLEEFKHDHVTRRNDERIPQTQYRCPPIHCQSCPLKDQCCRNPLTGRTIKRLDGEEYLTKHQVEMQTQEAKQLRKQRGSVIELSFGDLKQHRNGRRLHGRGLVRAEIELGLHVLARNIMTLHRLDTRPVTPNKSAA